MVFLVTPSEFKDCLIFEPLCASSRNPSPLADALTLSRNSPRFSSTCSSSHEFASATSTQHSQQQLFSWLIDPTYPQRKTNLHRFKSALVMAIISEFSHSTVKRPQFGSQYIVLQAFIILFLYLAFGVVIYCFTRHSFTAATENHPIVDAFYFCIVTMCTIGYGDITPNSTAAKIFSIFYVLVGYGFVDILLRGMVTYVLELLENHLLRAVKKGRMRIKVALVVVVLCIGVGVGVIHFVERLGWVDSFYLSVMSVTTVGYGDQAFKTKYGRIFATIWLLVSTYAVAHAFLYLTEARVDKRQRRILDQNITFAEFLAADIDNDGFVSKSEYIIYKLKEMGKVTEKDIMQISEKFDRLNTGEFGKITLGNLIKGHNG